MSVYLSELLIEVVAPRSECLSACILCICLSELLLGVVAPRSGCLSACICMWLSELLLGSMLRHNLYMCMCSGHCRTQALTNRLTHVKVQQLKTLWDSMVKGEYQWYTFLVHGLARPRVSQPS